MLTTAQPTGGVILLEDTTPHEEKSLLDLKARKKTTVSAPTPGQQLGGGDRNDFASAMSGFAPVTPGGFGAGSGAAAAAGVLNAVDEDDEGGEEAPVPDEFEVESEEEDDDDDDE